MFFLSRSRSKVGTGPEASGSSSLSTTRAAELTKGAQAVQLSPWMVQQVTSHQTPEHRAQFLRDYFSKISFFDQKIKEFHALSSELKNQVTEFCEALTHRDFLFSQIDLLKQHLPDIAKAPEQEAIVNAFLLELKDCIFENSDVVRGMGNRLPEALKKELQKIISGFSRKFTPNITPEALELFSKNLLATIAKFSGKLKETISEDYIFHFLEQGCDSKENVRSKIEDLGGFGFVLNFLDSESAPVQNFWRRFCQVQEEFQQHYQDIDSNINRYQGFLPLFHQLGDDVETDFQDNFFRFCCLGHFRHESEASFLVSSEDPPRPEEMIEFIFSRPVYVDAFIDLDLLPQGLRCAWKEWHRFMMKKEDKEIDLFLEKAQDIFSEAERGLAVCLKWSAFTRELLVKKILTCLEKLHELEDPFLIMFIADLGGGCVDDFIKADVSERNKIPQEIVGQLKVARDPHVEKVLPKKEYFLAGTFKFTGSGIPDAPEGQALNASDMDNLALVLGGLACN